MEDTKTLSGTPSGQEAGSKNTAVKVVQMKHAEGLALPEPATSMSAGMDLRAAVEEWDPLHLGPGERALVPTGLKISLPPGTEGQVRPRSGLAYRQGVTVLNAPGTIDADYRGEVKVLLVNHGEEKYIVSRGKRIAQLVVAPYVQVTLEKTEDLSSTARGSGGFGSTGRS